MSEFRLTAKTMKTLGDTPLVSVIIDNYNYGRFLAQAIDSVLNQTYPQWELIVVDDGSTDNSREVIESYGDRLIPIFQQNSGQGGAFSSGIAQSTGDILCFLDADDYFHESKLEKVVAAFQANPDWVQLSHLCISIDAKGDRFPSGASKSLSQGDVRPLLLKHGKYKSTRTSALAFRREALLNVLPIQTQKLPADSYLVSAVPFYGRVGQLSEPLMFYRIHGSNLHARGTDVDYHIRGREAIARYINDTLTRLGVTERFDIQNDADYRTFRAIQTGQVSLGEAFQILGLTLRECLAVGRNAKETLVRLTWGTICILFPEEGKFVLRYGLNQYLRHKLFAKDLPVELAEK